VIAYQTGSGHLPPAIRDLAGVLAAHGPSTAPRSFARVREIVDQVQGVHLADLLTRLTRRAPDPQAALDHVLGLATQAAADEST
jgi:hypothetical protein